MNAGQEWVQEREPGEPGEGQVWHDRKSGNERVDVGVNHTEIILAYDAIERVEQAIQDRELDE